VATPGADRSGEGLSSPEAERLARRLLDGVDLALPAGTRPVQARPGLVEDRLSTVGGAFRLVGLRFNPVDGRLVQLAEVVGGPRAGGVRGAGAGSRQR